MDQRGAPRYDQIVAELRQRIETGELSPGDRVPSTREITRQWGVAMATATKALTELRHQGLVRAVPGVGTVVHAGGRPSTTRAPAPPATHRRGGDSMLTAERIVDAAVVVADAEGLAGVSMRRVAAEIGVATMSLYRHVADKDDLLMRMMDAVFRQWRFPTASPEGWRPRLELAARMLWAMFRRHPWLAPAMSITRPQPIPSGVHYAEWVLASLDGRGLDLSTMLTAHITLFNYVRGTAVNVELEAEAEALSGLNNEEWMDNQEPVLNGLLGSGEFPVFRRVLNAEYDFDLDGLFEFGLQRLLDGIGALLGES